MSSGHSYPFYIIKGSKQEKGELKQEMVFLNGQSGS
jgi:hypothetical protein